MTRAKHKKRKKRCSFRKCVLWVSGIMIAWVLLFKVYPRAQQYLVGHREKKVPTAEYNETFADMNPVQLEAAKRIGVRSIKDRTFDFDACGGLQKVASCKAYHVDELTHSVPYLVPSAATLLKDIGVAFQNRLNEEELTAHKIVVTSLLRTEADVASLQKTNSNASANSAHCYGTTFDITYYRFRTCGMLEHDAYEDNLVESLADVLSDMRKQGRCYVRFEVNQHCFHVTCRM